MTNENTPPDTRDEKTDPRAGHTGAKRRRSRPWLAISLLVLTVVVIGGLFVWQRIEQREAAHAPDRAAARFAEAGLAFSFGATELSGAPARVTLAVETPRIEATEAGWSWSFNELTVDRLVYRMSTAALTLEGPHFLTAPSVELRIDGAFRGGVETNADTLRRLSLRATDLTASAAPRQEGGRPATLMELQICAPTIAGEGGCGEGAPPHDQVEGFPLLVYARMESLALRDGGRAYARLIGVADLSGPVRFDAPPPTPDALDIQELILRLAQGEGDRVDIVFSGRLDRQAGRLNGRLSVSSDDAEEAIERLVAAGALSETSAAALRSRVADSGRLAGVLEIGPAGWRMLDLGPEPILLTPPN